MTGYHANKKNEYPTTNTAAISDSTLSEKRNFDTNRNSSGEFSSDVLKDIVSKMPKLETYEIEPKPLFSGATVSPFTIAPPSNADKLQSLVATFYPQYATLNFIPTHVYVENSTPGVKGPLDLSQEPSNNPSNSLRYRCRLTLFDMVLECREVYTTWEEAKESVAKMGLDLLEEFNLAIKMRASDPRFERLFAPLIEEITSRLSSFPTDAAEKTKIALGLPGILSVEKYKTADSLPRQQSVLSPLLAAIYSKMNASGVAFESSSHSNEVLASEIAQSDPKDDKNCSPNSSMPPSLNAPVTQSQPATPPGETIDPVTALHEWYQQSQATLKPPVFEDFERINERRAKLFGCKCAFADKDYIVAANFASKKDAKKAVAALVCKDKYGIDLAFSNAPAVATSDTQQDIVYAKSRDILVSKTAPFKTTTVQTGPNTTLTVQEAKYRNFLPATERVDVGPLDGGRKYISVINETCQVHRLGLPEYQFLVGASFTSCFVAVLENPFTANVLERLFCGHYRSDDQEEQFFVSAAFSKKTDAKEDCAARAFLFLVEKGVLDSAGCLLVRPNNRRQYPSTSSNHQGSTSRYFARDLPSPIPFGHYSASSVPNSAPNASPGPRPGVPLPMPPLPSFFLPPPPFQMSPSNPTGSSPLGQPPFLPLGFHPPILGIPHPPPFIPLPQLNQPAALPPRFFLPTGGFPPPNVSDNGDAKKNFDPRVKKH